MVTDFTTSHNTWFHTDVTRCFVPTDDCANLARKNGLLDQQLIQRGGLLTQKGGAVTCVGPVGPVHPVGPVSLDWGHGRQRAPDWSAYYAWIAQAPGLSSCMPQLIKKITVLLWCACPPDVPGPLVCLAP